jgi:hypothetical protein
MMRMPRLLRELLADRSANAVVLTAFSVLSLVGGAGLATDTIQWTLSKRQLQRMTDSAALAGAFALAKGSNASSAATTELGRYNLLTLNGSPTIETPPSSGSYASNSKAVRITINAQKPLPFSSMFMSATPNLQATATAAAVGFGTYCVISLESTTATGVTFQGSSNVTLGCGVTTNSQGSQAVYAGGSSTISASPISAVGVVPSSNNYSTGTVLNSYSIAQPDPYSAVGLPTGYSCSGQLSVGSNQNKTVQNNSGGVQCYRGMDLKGTVTFDPGTYVIDGSTGGSLTVNAGAVVKCTACTFILTTTSADMSTVANVKMNGNATWQVAAPDTGAYAGIMLYQDRRALSGYSNSVTGDNTSMMQGAIYFPSQEVDFSGSSAMDTKCIQIVARTIYFTGNNYIQNVCPVDSSSKAIAGIQIRLVD